MSKEKGKLVARTGWLVQVLSLGLWLRTVTVDPKRREVRLQRRAFWFFHHRRRIPFPHVEAVTYGYAGSRTANSSWVRTREGREWYTVGLRLYGDEDVHLFHFSNDELPVGGSEPDWLDWDEYLGDAGGAQTRASKGYVELLCRMIGVTLLPGR